MDIPSSDCGNSACGGDEEREKVLKVSLLQGHFCVRI